MSSKKGLGKFLVGVGIGVGLGILFAPDKGEVTRKKLKDSITKLIDKIRNLDKEEVKEQLQEKIEKIQKELEDLDKEKALKIAKEKGKKLQKEAEALVVYAKKKATPVIEDAANEVLQKVIDSTKVVLTRLEKTQEKTKKAN